MRAAGSLPCGSNVEEAGYSTRDAHGNHSALDRDICRAVATAVLGSNAHFTVTSYRDEEDALAALRSGGIVLLATSSPTLSATRQGLGFASPIFYDFQGFLVNKTLGITSSKDLAGKKTCFLGGTEIESEVGSYMQRQNIHWLPFPFQEEGEMEAALVTRNCAAITADVSQLACERLAFKNAARNFEILPEVIAKDPLSPAYHLGDPQWAGIVDWTVQVLIQAEESGVTRSNLGAMKTSPDTVIRRLLGADRGWGQYLGLDDDWAFRVIEAVGNYGEMFDRDLGSGSPLKLPRGANELWTRGGQMYARPMR